MPPCWGALHSGIHLPGSIKLNGRSQVGGGGRGGDWERDWCNGAESKEHLQFYISNFLHLVKVLVNL